MQLLPIPPIPQILPIQTSVTVEKQEAGNGSFATMLNDSIKKLNDTQVNADNMARDFLTGEVEDLHQVTVAMQEAKLTMQLAVEVRNKVIEAYQEISRMQV